MSEKKTLFLLDAMALIYRAYFALSRNPRINSKGLNTSAMLGFTNTLLEVLKKENPTHIGVAFDTMAPTVRHIDFTGYKANREKMPEDLALSIPYIKELIRAFNIPILEADGYEADDVIGTLAKKAEKAGFTTYMMTPDKDFGQLISEQIFMYKPARAGNSAEKLGVAEICEKFGIKRPEQVKDILGLWGDAADNIPGIPGVGQVTARKLLAEYDTIENLVARAETIKNPKLKAKVIEFGQQALVCKELATIILDTPIAFDETQLIRKAPDTEALKKLFTELEFRNMAKRVFTELSLQAPAEEGQQASLFNNIGAEDEGTIEPVSSFKTIKNSDAKYHLADTAEKRLELIQLLNQQSSFCFDTETTGLDVLTAKLVGLSFAWMPGEAWYVPIPADEEQAQSILNEFKAVLENTSTEKIAQNIKYDLAILQAYQVKVQGPLFDTMLAHYLLQPDMRHNMDLLAETYLNYQTVKIESLIGKKGKNQLNMRQAQEQFPEQVKDYACEDADITLQLKQIFEQELEKTQTRELFDTIEMPLVPVLAAMEAEGVKLNKEDLNDFSQTLKAEIETLENEIFELAGKTFNIASPRQLGEVLFEDLKITDKPKRTKTKQYSTSEDVLQKLLNKHDIVPKILEFRSLTKLKSTYVDALPALINSTTGRIHTSYNQAVAATGRLSSNNPNLQNIPIRTERGREIRKAFVPRDENHLLLAADYSQVELRIIAELSGDTAMLNAFNHGVDIHSTTAAKVYKVDLEAVSKEQRRHAKTVNFGIIYGISSFGLAERLGISRGEAAGIKKSYFEEFPAIKAYMDNTIAFAREHGYVETIMKRRRYLRDINSGNAVVRGFAERNAINAPIQGASADMIKIAMIRIHQKLQDLKLKTKMILQVHDELVFDTPKEEVEQLIPIIRKEMQEAIRLKVPLEVEIETGKNWLEAH